MNKHTRINALTLAALAISADPETQAGGDAGGAPTPAAKPPKEKKAKPAAKKAPAKKAAAKKPAKKKAADGDKAEKGPGVLRQYAPEYHRDTEKKTASGNVSVDCNDDVANKFRGKDLDAVYTAAAKILGEPEADLRKKYKHLNVGMQRMNLGNRVRAIVNAK